MRDNININAGRDGIVAQDGSIVEIENKISEATNITDSLKNKLKELTQAVADMIKDMPDDKAKEVTGNFQTLVDEASKEKPRRKWYELSGESLIENAKAAGSFGKKVIDTTQAILELLGG